MSLRAFYKEINKATSSFLWQNKTPRVKLTTLQAPCTKGGLNIPNFRCYYLASQFRPIWTWLHGESSEVRWLSIKQHELKATPLQIIPFLGTKKNLSSITKNPIILNTFGAWQESHTMFEIDISLLRKTPLWDNPNIPYPLADGTLKNGSIVGLQLLKSYTVAICCLFNNYLSNLIYQDIIFFKFLQIRHWVQDTSRDFPFIPNKSPLEDLFTQHTSFFY